MGNSERTKSNGGRSTSSSSSVNMRNADMFRKKRLEQEIDFDTLGSSLEKTNDILSNAIGSWQTADYMNANRNAISNMYDRLKKVNEYSRITGNTDNALADYMSAYNSALENWDDKTTLYSNYLNADAYNSAMQKYEYDEKYKGSSYKDIQKHLSSVDPGSDEYKYLKTYSNYSNIDDVTMALNQAREERAKDNAHASDSGMEHSGAGHRKGRYTDSDAFIDQLEKNYNKIKLNNASDAYSFYKTMPDFAEKSQYASTITENNYPIKGALGEFLGMPEFTYGDNVYEYVNNQDGARDYITKNDPYDYIHSIDGRSYENMTEDEVSIYNYLYATKGKDVAQKYLDDIQVSLNKETYDEFSDDLKNYIDSHGAVESTILSALSIPVGMYGSMVGLKDTVGNLISGNNVNPYSQDRMFSNAASDIRQFVGEKIEENADWNLLGVDIPSSVPSFLYQTLMSMADSYAGAMTMGVAYTPFMGSSAYQQREKELKEQGADDTTARVGAFASGLFEAAFEEISIEHLVNIKNIDAKKRIFTEALKQGGIEASEEVFTELANFAFDTVFRGDNSDIAQKINEWKEKGYSDSDIARNVATELGGQLALAGLGGFLSGAGMGGLKSTSEFIRNKKTGKSVKANGHTQDAFDIAMSDTESDTYKYLTELTENGITAENIKDAQLGSMVNQKLQENAETMSAKKSNIVDKVRAYQQNRDLAGMAESKGSRQKRVDEYVSNLSEDKAKAFKAVYDENSNLDSLIASFEMVYEKGSLGIGSDTVIENSGELTARQALDTYNVASKEATDKVMKLRNDVANEYARRLSQRGKFDSRIIDMDSKTTDGSKVNWNTLTSKQKDGIRFLELFSKATGLNVRLIKNAVVDGKIEGKNGSYDFTSNTIEIDVYAGINNVEDMKDSMISTIIPTMSHEMTHWMKKASPEMYRKIQEYVMNTISESDKKITNEERVAYELGRMKEAHPDQHFTAEDAIDEIVARACEDCLSHSNYARKLLNTMSDEEKKSFVEKVKDLFKNLMDWVNKTLSMFKSSSPEAKILGEYKWQIQKLSRMWDATLKDAVSYTQKLEQITGQKMTNGISEDGTTILGENVMQMSERTYANGGKQFLENWLKDKVESKDISKEDAQNIIDQTDMVYGLMQDIKAHNDLPDYLQWAKTDVTINKDGDQVSVIVKNGEYTMNLDFSQVCKKRVALNAVLNAMVKSNDLSVYTLTEKDVATLNDIIKKHDFEIACALCFVDSKRYRVGSWAESFCEGVHTKKENKYGFNEMVRSLVPDGSGIQIDEFNFTGRDIKNNPTENLLRDADDSKLDFTLIDKILSENDPKSAQYRYAKAIRDHKDLRSILNPSEIISSIGLDSIRVNDMDLYGLINGHQGTAKPKFAHDAVAYGNDILRATSWTPEKAKYVGGVRMQSFSDFMANLTFDYVQMIAELSARGLTSHAYTKEPLFVKLFGLTGIKINMSLVPRVAITEEQKARFKKLSDAKKKTDAEYLEAKKNAGLYLDENGEWQYAWEDETFDYDIAMEIMADPRYTKNCGTIAVGVSDRHIEKLLADPRISMVIPYHKSSLNHIVATMRNIELYNDYTDYQNTRGKDGKKLAKDVKDFDFYGDLYGKDGKKGTHDHDPKKTAENYKKWCKKNGYYPKFDQFKDNPNYYKLLIDFSVYDINNNMAYTEQQAVQPIYPSEEEFKDLVVNGVQRNGKTYGGLKQSQNTSDKLKSETDTIIDEYRNELKEQYGKDVLNSGEQFADRNTSKNESDGIRQQIRRYADELNKMESVADLKLLPTDASIETLRKMIISELSKTGFKVDRKNFGIINFNEKDIRYGTNYAQTIEERTAFLAIPRVLKRGIIIGEHDNHKNRSKHTLTIGAKITINGIEGNMGIVVNLNGNHYYAHRVLMPDGSIFTLTDTQKNTVDGTLRGVTKIGSLAETTNTVSTANLPYNDENVNYADRNAYAPTFYSQMSRIIDDIKTEKIGAASVVSYLKGKGVKDEEIKWSGIEAFVEGKKSITKAELQEFARGSMLQIEEKTLRDYSDGLQASLGKFEYYANKYGFSFTYDDYIEPMDGSFMMDSLLSDISDYYNDGDISEEEYNHLSQIAKNISMDNEAKWADYKTKDGTNYREILFKMPNSEYENFSMIQHWGEPGVLAHARIQDMILPSGEKMLFIDEIQSDWHNASAKAPTKKGTHIVKTTSASGRNLYYLMDNKTNDEIGRVTSREIDENKIPDNTESVHDYAVNKFGVEDAPFQKTYTDFVMKRLIRMAAEGGYDYIGWTTGKMQEERWSDEYAEGYRIEYDQDIPKFVNKYGKKWGIKTEDVALKKEKAHLSSIDKDRMELIVRRLVNDYSINKSDAERYIMRHESVDSSVGLKIQDALLNDRLTNKVAELWNKMNPVAKTVHGFKISDSMKQSVLYEGQPMYSDRGASEANILQDYERIKKENDKLREDIERLKERLAIEKKLTKGNTFNERQLEAVARHLKNVSNSNTDVKEVVAGIKDVYSYISETDNLDWNTLMLKAYDVADTMLQDQRAIRVTNDYFKYLLNDIRNTRISLSDEQIQEAEHILGKNWKREFANRVKITDNGTSLDSQWQEWSAQYPDIFDADVNPNDQVTALAEILATLREGSVTLQNYNGIEAKRNLASEIYNQYWNVSSIKTTADKYDAQIKELNYKHRQAMKELRNDYKERLENQKKADAIYYGKVIHNLRKQRDERTQNARELGRKRLAEYKDRQDKNKKIKAITDKALKLNQWLTKNSKDEHIPEVMKAPVSYLLNAIDFSSKQLLGMTGGENAYTQTKKDISLSKALEMVHKMAVDIQSAYIDEKEKESVIGMYVDLPQGFEDMVSELSKKVNDALRSVGDNEFILNQMSLEELEALDDIITIIKTSVTKLNKFFAVANSLGVADLSSKTIRDLDALGKHKGMDNGLSKMINWGNANPYFAFKRFGEGGKAVFEALQNGWDKFAYHVNDIINFSKEIYTEEEIKEWEEDIREFDVLEPATEEEKMSEDYKPTYKKVKMSVPQIMSLYCLSKREQARGHLFGGGARVTDIKVKGKLRTDTISQTDGFLLTETELDTILKSLSARQIEVADALQLFMNTVCADWGNEVSMLRFGYNAFGEENYFPIQSDKNNLSVDDPTEQQNSLFRLLNMQFTKALVKNANNRIEIADIFDVFAQHASDMAKYNALALPILDTFKWYNYKEKEQKGDTQFYTKSLKTSLENAYGVDAKQYITTFLRDMNGEHSAGRNPLGMQLFSRAKVASVGFNLRVAALQPTSYARAYAVIDGKYLTKALTMKPQIEKAEKHCGMALWKSLGFFDINVQRGVTDLIKHNQTNVDKIVEASMKGAEMGDKLTWGFLWNACELEVRDKQSNLIIGSDDYYNAVALRLRDVIYNTQVVDSTMTRSQMMRSKDGFDKMTTAFMSEPTLSFNMLQDAYFDYKNEVRRGLNDNLTKKEAHERAFRKYGKKIARVTSAYTITNLIAGLVEAGFDAFRDTDDELLSGEEFRELFLKNFANDMSIMQKIPLLRDFASALQGYSASRTDTQWLTYFVNMVKDIDKLANGNGNAYKTASDMLKAVSYGTGLPFYNAWRDATATINTAIKIFNEVVGEEYPTIKVK